MTTPVDVRIGPPGPRPLPRRPRASWHARANAVVLAWLALTVVVALAGHRLPAPRWLLIHVFLLGAVTNAIITWTEHFAIALLRVPAPARWWPMTRLAVLNAAAAVVLYGVTGGHPGLATGGATVVVGVVCAHVAVLLRSARQALAGRFAHVLAWYTWSGAALVTGGTLGGLMISGWVPDAWHPRVKAAHVQANLLGWVGLAVLGTLFTLWPTVLRTRVAENADSIARTSLRIAAAGLIAAVGGLLTGARWIAVAGLVLYAAAAVLALVPFVTTALRRHPHTPAAWTLAAGTGWFVVAVTADLATVATRPPDQVADGVEPLVPLTLVGFVVQTLVGALTFLLPVVLGGGPTVLKRNSALLEKGWRVRLIAVNVAVPLVVLPVPGRLSQSAWVLEAAGLAVFVGLAAGAVARSRGLRLSPAVAGVLIGCLVTASAVGVAVSGRPGPSAHPVTASGIRTVAVTLAGMRIRPGTIDAAPGTRLVLRVTNRDAQHHDLRLSTGARTPTLNPGQAATLRLPPLTGPLDGWCTVAGHRAAGMTMRIRISGTATASGSSHVGMDHSGMSHSGMDHTGTTQAGPLDLTAPMSPGWHPYDAALRPAPGGTDHHVEIHTTERDLEVAPGVRQRMWTFGGTVPGPALRGHVGDVFTVTLVNDGTMGHGIDFHAGSLAPDGPMRTIRPGERLTYRFRADHAGAWLYHCSTMPMLQHIGNGMYGAVIIDPPHLPRADREYVLLQSELYLGTPGGTEQVAKMRDGRPDAWMFNGTAAGYDHAPLTARAGERVRIWVVAAGPGSGTAFHLVGARFDTVYKEGAYLLRPGDHGGAQVLDLAAAQGGFVETVLPEPGHYPFVDHDMRHGEAGAHGVVEVAR